MANTHGIGIPDTTQAAAWGALGFSIRPHVAEFVDENKPTQHQFFIGAFSVWHEGLKRDDVARQIDGGLRQTDPLHPFFQALRAARAYKALTVWLHNGKPFRLNEVAPGAWEPVMGETEGPAMMLRRDVVQTNDLPLVAALTTVGVPVIDVVGSAGRHAFLLPATGHPTMHPRGAADTAQLARRGDAYRLLLETTDPSHSLIPAYLGAKIYVELVQALKTKKRLLIFKAPKSARRMLCSEGASPRVLGYGQRFFKVRD